MLLCALLLSILSCSSSHNITKMQSNNYSYRVKSLVIHFTAVNYEESVNYLVKEGGGVSSHYLIPQLDDETYPHRSIKVHQLVDENQRAWHAGLSYWQGRSGLNDSSIGIEIVNVPECIERDVPPGFIKPKAMCIYPEFESKQIELLIELSKKILARNPDISPTAVIGHSDIAPSRKNDPGPRFPWQKLYEAGIGAWYENDTVAQYWQLFSEQAPSIGLVQKALNIYGYGIDLTGILDRQTQDTLGAFQMHFLPWEVSYQHDDSTISTLFALLDKYFPSQLTSLLEQYKLEIERSDAVLANTQLSNNQLSISIDPSQQGQGLYKQNRTTFIAQAHSGILNINTTGISSADIYINEQKLNLGNTFQTINYNAEVTQSVNINKRTQNGINSLRVENIRVIDGFESPQFLLGVPFPEIVNSENPAFDFSKLDSLIQNDVKNGFPGANLLVLHKGKIIKHQAYGFARKYANGGELLREPQPLTTNTLFDLASNTKVFATTLAIMKLVDQGKLSLTTPLSNYLAEYNGDGRNTRTIADLLAHTSGYNSEVQFFKSDNPFGDALYSQDKTLTSEFLLNSVPFGDSRRNGQLYSDTNFMILGLLIERVTGMPLDEYVESEIYQPLGLQNTLFVPLQKGKQSVEFAATEIKGNSRGGRIEFDNIRDYVLQGEVHDEKAFYSMQGVAGHAGLFSTTSDLAVLAQMLLNGGGYANHYLFNQHTINRFVHPEFVNDSIGLGWRLASPETAWHFGPYASALAFGHTGWTGTATVIDPELDLAIIYLSNKRHSNVQQNGANLSFQGDQYDSAKYGNIMTLVYEAILAGTAKHPD